MRTMTVVVPCERIVMVANSGRGRRENIQKAFVTVTQTVTQVGSVSPYRPYLSEIRTGMTTWVACRRCYSLRGDADDFGFRSSVRSVSTTC